MGQRYEWDVRRPRDRHLMPGGPKRILTIDGGGIRGLLSCGILLHIENELKSRIADPVAREKFVLADYYDFIAGTSTGSIVAAWLALGNRVVDLQQLYLEMGSNIFSKARRFGQVFVAKFDADKLATELHNQLGEVTLSSDALVTGFGVTAKRMDTGSAWLLANNPKARYWDGSDTDRPNADYQLRHVVRASAAAPAYFDHVDVQIEHGREPGAFMDGAVAGLNNPSTAFWLYTTLPGYGLKWPNGADNLLITSVGTGHYRQRFSGRKLGRMAAIKQAIFSLAGSIQDVAQQQLLLMQALSVPHRPYPINSEVDSLTNQDNAAAGQYQTYCIATQPQFHFQRYDANLEARGLAALGITAEDGRPLGPRMIKNLQAMDCSNAANLQRLKDTGERAGEMQVSAEQFPESFNISVMGKAAEPSLSETLGQQVPTPSQSRHATTSPADISPGSNNQQRRGLFGFGKK
ncbi:MAG: patatin-like phospholipase family protein [Pseudomonadota bacterium]